MERLVPKLGFVWVLDLDREDPSIVITWQDRSGKTLWLSEAHHTRQEDKEVMYFGSWHENYMTKRDANTLPMKEELNVY